MGTRTRAEPVGLRRRLAARALGAALFATLAAAPAAADDADPPAGATATARRALPDYDGRAEPGPDAIDAALWVPRILTAPLYLVSEYLIRRPLGALITEMERSRLFELLFDTFVFGPTRNIAVFPTAFFDFGLAPSVGVYGYWSDFLGDGNRISLHAATGGSDWLSIAVADTWRPTDEVALSLRGSALKRPDQQLGGIGYDATQAQTSRYGVEQVEASLGLALSPWRRSRIELTGLYRGVGYVDEPWGGDPSIGQRHAPEDRPEGFATGYSSARLQVRGTLDTRERSELAVGGVRALVHAAPVAGFGGLPEANWVRWGADLWLGTDALGRGRVVSLRGVVDLVSTVDGAPVPFTELPELGGLGPLGGFQPGLVRGAAVGAVVLDYAWPVWAFLDGSIHVGVGNAFGPHFEDLEAERLRMSFGLSLAPRISGEHAFEIGFALGTETFARGADISSVRFVVGARNGL